MPVMGAFIVPHPPLIIPEIGKGQEKGIQNTINAYNKVAQKIAAMKPETIIVISPHSIMYEDYIHISPGSSAFGNFSKFGENTVSFEKNYDSVFAETLTDQAQSAGIPAGTLGEKDKSLDHGVLVPLYFIEQQYKNYELVRISISGLPFLQHYQFGKCIAKTSDTLDRNIVIVASGDLSHKLKEDGPYGFASEGPEFDNQAIDAMKTGDFLRLLSLDEKFCDKAAECGLRSFISMAGVLDGIAVEPEILSYEGPFGVGYAVCSYLVKGTDDTRHFDKLFEKEKKEMLLKMKDSEDEYVRLARLSLETYIMDNKRMKRPELLTAELLLRRAGVFVSLKKDGRLRGCIGTITPLTSCVADEIIRNAISAATEDPRFEPVTKEELPFLVYSVDVLDEAEPVSSIKELDVKRYGVIVTSGKRRGLLLPNLEGVDTEEQQVQIALQKAGILQGENYQIERFEVVRHK
ncbi:MAG: AmmeMemoRadiSam system protein A [Clostridiales bacterium]|nr:AmmeMemoRadiSam system protein A [Clostridiales bacterium]